MHDYIIQRLVEYRASSLVSKYRTYIPTTSVLLYPPTCYLTERLPSAMHLDFSVIHPAQSTFVDKLRNLQGLPAAT